VFNTGPFFIPKGAPGAIHQHPTAAQSATLLPLLKQVHALHVAAHPDIYAPITDDTAITTWFAAHCDAKGTKILTAQDGDQIIGFAILKLSPQHTHTPLHHPQRTGVIDLICVHSDHQRRGVAGRLMTHAQTLAIDAGATELTASVAAFNTPSAHLMAQCGLRPLTTRLRKAL
jgi:ribosomal protein S18 acetylase RimI-like enzyme